MLKHDSDSMGQWHSGKRHGVFLWNQSSSGHPHFRLTLYKNDQEIASTSFSNLNSDGTTACAII